MWSFLERLRRRTQPVTGGIDQTWSNDTCVGVRGWMVHKKGPLTRAEIEVDGIRTPITNWHPRPDVRKLLPNLDETTLQRCGFWVQVPRLTMHRVALIGSDGTREGRVSWKVDGVAAAEEGDAGATARRLFGRFIDQVNTHGMHVLEVGSRVVAPGSVSKRPLFPEASSYTGFDYYMDDNTDVAGDAHRLSDYFAPEQFDAVFSYSVLEHLAMPWLFSAEVNRVLKPGGITFHHTHFAWPLHERPWDFWRFSDAGLRVLFSRPLGFDIVGSGMFEPVRMHMEQPVEGMESFPEHPAFGGAVVMAQKIADCKYDRGAWDTGVEDVVGSSVYPKDSVEQAK